MQNSVDWREIICILILFVVVTSLVLSVYDSSGVGWDFLARYLNGRTLASGYFYTHLGIFSNKIHINFNLAGINYTYNVTPGLSVGNHIYFDDVWDPLASVIMAFFVLGLGAHALVAYLVFLVALLFLASYVTAKNIGIDPLVLTSLMVGPYVLLVTIFYNGAEILALSLALLSIGYAVCKRYSVGLGLGLMGLARYDSLILAPIVLLIGDRKRVLKSIAIAFLVTIPWLVLNLAFFGNPLQSYVTDLAETQVQAGGPLVLLTTIGSIVWYPLIMLAIAAIALAYMRKESIRRIRKPLYAAKKGLRGQRARVLLLSLVLSLVGLGITYGHAQGSIRLGYLVYLSVAVIAAVALAMLEGTLALRPKTRLVGRMIPYAVFFVSMVFLLHLYSSWSAIHFNALGNLGFRYPAYLDATHALEAHGLAGCAVVSNAWPYLDYYNTTAYPPYFCNATIERMPIVAFPGGPGVSDYCVGSIYNLTGISRRFNYPNFTIYLPENYTCR